MRRTIELVVKAVSAVLLAVAIVGLPVTAQAAPPIVPASTLVLSCAQPSGAQTTISGQLTLSGTGAGIPGQTVTLSGAGMTGPATTGADGSFTWTIPTPAPGTYTVTARFDGSEAATASLQGCGFSVPQPKVDTTVTVMLDSDSVESGGAIGVSGVLTAASGQPVDSAQISISCSLNCDPETAVTGADGTYQTSVQLPDGTGQGSSVTVTATFAGDDVYNTTSNQAAVAVVAAADTTAPAAPETTATQTSTVSTKSTSSHAPASPTPSAAASLDPAFATEGVLMLSVFAGVAAAGVVVLIAIGIISNQRHRLAKGEQRGFGSDFGKHEH